MLLHTKLLGGVSSLVSNIGTGIRDFFTEPVHGLLAGEIVTTFEGIGKGTTSLVQRVVCVIAPLLVRATSRHPRRRRTPRCTSPRHPFAHTRLPSARCLLAASSYLTCYLTTFYFYHSSSLRKPPSFGAADWTQQFTAQLSSLLGSAGALVDRSSGMRPSNALNGILQGVAGLALCPLRGLHDRGVTGESFILCDRSILVRILLTILILILCCAPFHNIFPQASSRGSSSAASGLWSSR